MTLLFPSDPLSPRRPDGSYAPEWGAARAAGLTTVLFSFEDLQAGRLTTQATLAGPVLYRGWMLTLECYETLEGEVARFGGRLITTAAAYRRAHHLPGWYPVCRGLTAHTLCVSPDADFSALWEQQGWAGCFVKDHVKSLTTARGSIARTPAEVLAILQALRQHRGSIEGGVCLRQLEQFRDGTEERFFAHHGLVGGRTDAPIPDLVREVAKRVNLPFISIDVAERADGTLRLVEVGDGQVSDRKGWPPERLVALLQSWQLG